MLADRQAEDIILLDISKVAGFADYFVIASALNPRHMKALYDTIEEELLKEGVKPTHSEGSPESGWVLLDYDDIIVHVFTPEERAYYSLEKLWSKGVEIVRIQ